MSLHGPEDRHGDYTAMYDCTGNRQTCLSGTAQKLSGSLWSSESSEDKIPYWDFDAPEILILRGCFCGAIMASAFIELSQ